MPEPHVDTARDLLVPSTNRIDLQALEGAAQKMAGGLLERRFLVPEDLDEDGLARRRRDARLQRTDRLELILMPTEACNFRCHYCYEDFGVGLMPAGVREGVRNLLRRRHAENPLTCCWCPGSGASRWPAPTSLSS
ncbi:hypothetical protein GCM10027418_00320 [Mariniluteicoccus endophyticus]